MQLTPGAFVDGVTALGALPVFLLGVRGAADVSPSAPPPSVEDSFPAVAERVLRRELERLWLRLPSDESSISSCEKER